MRFERRMSATEALMWSIDRDPVLRSSFINVSFCEGTPDIDRFRRRMGHAVGLIPRLRQRVVDTSFGPPEWADDADFDLDYHVRHLSVPAPGHNRQLLDLAELLAQDAFDPSRPLWQLTIVEGLERDRAALLSKMHHTITDGVGGVRLSTMFIDIEADAPEPEPVAPMEEEEDPSLFESAARFAVDTVRQVGRTAGAVAGTLTRPGEAVETARSLARQVLVTEGAQSPLWRGKRSVGRRFEILRVPMPGAREAAKRLGGTLNDLYVTGVAGGAGAYHRRAGAPVEELRMAMPISTREDRSAGGNSFAPSRVLVPAGIEDAAERFALIRQRLSTTKSERALGLADTFAGVLTSLPSPLLLRLARQQVETVDFATSNVRGAPFDLYVAGARIQSNHPMGPTAGTAFNATLLSYRDSLDIGINIDTAAVDDPGLLCQCIEQSLAEVVAAGT